jgi:hypothetical protein
MTIVRKLGATRRRISGIDNMLISLNHFVWRLPVKFARCENLEEAHCNSQSFARIANPSSEIVANTRRYLDTKFCWGDGAILTGARLHQPALRLGRPDKARKQRARLQGARDFRSQPGLSQPAAQAFRTPPTPHGRTCAIGFL